MRARQERLAPGDVPRYLRLYDDGGRSADRFTIVFTGRYRQKTGGACWYVGSSGAPFHPQGVYQHGEADRPIDRPGYWHLGKRIAWGALPSDVQRAVWADYADLWDLQVPPKYGGRRVEAQGHQER